MASNAVTNDPIDLGTNFLQLFTPEERVRFLRAEDARIGALAKNSSPVGHIERAGAGLGVVHHPLGVDAVAP